MSEHLETPAILPSATTLDRVLSNSCGLLEYIKMSVARDGFISRWTCSSQRLFRAEIASGEHGETAKGLWAVTEHS